jgi:hypothetical protein
MGTIQICKKYKPFLMLSAIIMMILMLDAPPPTLDRLSAQNLPTQVEALRGREWNGSECCKWQFNFIQKSGPFFRAKWWNPNGQQLTDDNITINILNDTVEIIRAGGSSAGGCTYKGKIRVGSAEGEYWCNGRYAGTWGATIRP